MLRDAIFGSSRVKVKADARADAATVIFVFFPFLMDILCRFYDSVFFFTCFLLGLPLPDLLAWLSIPSVNESTSAQLWRHTHQAGRGAAELHDSLRRTRRTT